MFTVYALYSKNYGNIYIGYSSDIQNRLESDNVYANKGYTKKYQPSKLIYSEDMSLKRGDLFGGIFKKYLSAEFISAIY